MHRRSFLAIPALTSCAIGVQPDPGAPIVASEYRYLASEIESLAKASPPWVQWALIKIMEAPWDPTEVVKSEAGVEIRPSADMRRTLAFLQLANGQCKDVRSGLWT